MIIEFKCNEEEYFKNKCGNCIYFNTENKVSGNCINMNNKLRDFNRLRYYNSRSCIQKEVK